MSTSRDLADQVLALVGDRAEAQVMVSNGPTGLTRFANSFIHQNVAEERESVALKVSLGGRVATGETSATDRDALAALVERTLAAARLRPVDPDWPGLALPEPATAVDHYDEATALAGPADRAARVASFVDAGRHSRAAGYCDTEGGTAVFADSAGQRLEGRFSRATIDGIHQTGTSAGKGHATSSRLRDLDAGGVGRSAADTAGRAADPTDTAPGEYEVVLLPECVASILSFLAFYGFNAKQVLEGQSYVRRGERQFDGSITIRDDATRTDAIGLGFDSEGTPRRPVDFVVDGVSTGLAHDRRTAARMDTTSTGHAVPGGDVWGAFPQNLFLAPGDRSVEEMIASIDRGLLVSEFNYCRILDPKTQVVTGLTRNGTFLIERGEIGRPVSNLRFTQSFVEALGPGAVRSVGREARFADAEFGVGLAHVPALHLAAWKFTGGARG